MGTWIKGFAMNTGMRSSVKAKLWTVITGLELAWLLGLKKVI